MEQTSEVKIRTATINDLDALTELHCASFLPEEHVPMLLGRRYVAATYRWLVTSKISYVLVACLDDKILGLVAVCDHSFTRPMFMACLGEFVLSIIKNPLLLIHKNLWERLLRNPEKPTTIGSKIINHPEVAQMTIGAVDKNFRGLNVFPKLIEATKGASLSRGSRAIRAGVYKSNAPSRRVFIKGEWLEAPTLETVDTVFYVACLDKEIARVLELDNTEA